MNAPRHIGFPEPGFFTVKLVKNGPLCPLIIFEDGSPPAWLGEETSVLRTMIQGIGYLCHFLPNCDPIDLEILWPGSRPIPEAECRFLCEAASWQADFDPSGPLANPRRPIDRATAELF